MMTINGNLKIAVQKKGRLADSTMQLLRACGLEIENYADRLIVSARNFSLDILFLRDDDIPEYVQDGVADLGIVGENVVLEKEAQVDIIKKLGFGRCDLMLATPENYEMNSIIELNGKTIATSYPNILKNFIKNNNLDAKVIMLSGSVEIAPSLGVADLICDIVSTGNTLKLNKLKKSFQIFNSEAVLIKSINLSEDENKTTIVNNLLSRINSVIIGKKSKYLMMNIEKKNLDAIRKILPALSSPTILPLADENMLAVHAVIPSESFWNMVTDLKTNGASGLLLLPIDNMVL